MKTIIIVLGVLLIFGAGFVVAEFTESSLRVGDDRSKFDGRTGCGDDDCRKGDSIPATIELREETCFRDDRLGSICLPEGLILSVLFYDEQ